MMNTNFSAEAALAVTAPLLERSVQLIEALRERRSLVHVPSNSVTMPFVANTLLAFGAKAMMTWSDLEAPQLVAKADALLLNTGVMHPSAYQVFPKCAEVAAAESIPWVLDPAAITAGSPRLELVQQLLALRPWILRANASEVLLLAGQGMGGRGPESADKSVAAISAAQTIANKYGVVVAISGAEDVIVAAGQVAKISHGTELLSLVTGTGCALGALSAALLAPQLQLQRDDAFPAAIGATLALTRAAEQVKAKGPGSFAAGLLDELYRISAAEITAEPHLELFK